MKKETKKRDEKPSTLQRVATYVGQLMLIALVVIPTCSWVVRLAVTDQTNVEVMAQESQEAKQADQRLEVEKAAAAERDAQKAREHAEAAAKAKQDALEDSEEVRLSLQ